MNDDLDSELDVKDAAGSREFEPRDVWVRQNLDWDAKRQMWEIPGTRYSQAEPGTVEQANHLFLQRTFPWLETESDGMAHQLYLEPDKVEWMPLWNPFRKYVGAARTGDLLDDDAMAEVSDQAVEKAWRETYAREFAGVLFARFGDQFKAANPLAEIETFLLGSRGLAFFERVANQADEFWETDRPSKPTISVDRVADAVTWPQLHAAMYPQKDQLQLSMGERPGDQGQMDMFEAVADDDDEEDMLTDVMRASKMGNPEVMLSWLDDNLLEEHEDFYTLTSYSNFSGSLADQANFRYFRQKYPWLKVLSWAYDGKSIGIPKSDVRANTVLPDEYLSLVHDYESLQDYPILDQAIYDELEREKRQRAWDNWVRRSYYAGLATKFPDLDDALDDFRDNEAFQSLFEDARDRSGEEWTEESGGDQTVHVAGVVEATDEAMVRGWMDQAGPNGPQVESLSEDYQYSCLMAEAPPELADALLQWGRMYVKDDEVYTDDEGDKGRETEPHVTVKWGLHEGKPSRELLRIIEETQPFEIAVLGSSLFESSDEYDVLKFDVESDALRALNARVSELPHTDTHPEYRPHLTVSYIQKGTCRDLVGKPLIDAAEPAAMRFLVKAVLFSGKGDDARKTRLFLGKPNLSVDSQ